MTESNILCECYDLILINAFNRHEGKVIGTLYYIPDSHFKLYRHVDSQLTNHVDFIYINERDLNTFIGSTDWTAVHNGKVHVFPVYTLLDASKIRNYAFHEGINKLPSFEW